MTKVLKECQLTDDEYELGPGSWTHFQDPMPPIVLESEDDYPENEFLTEQ